MSEAWTVRADAISNRSGFVGVPTNFFDDPNFVGASHVHLSSADGRTAVLPPFLTGTPEGNQLIVEPSILGLRDGETLPVAVKALRGADYRRYWLLGTRSGRLALLGLVLVAIGQAIQISLDVGEAWPWLTVGSAGIALAKAAKGGLTIIGAALALYQTVLRS